jgi:hypothetical protein
MDGLGFYNFLRQKYTQNGQPLYRNFTFCDWLYKPKFDSYSFRFNIPNNGPKSIQKDILINAWIANQPIDEKWLNNLGFTFHKDCRLIILKFLVEEYKYLKQ